MSKVFYRKFSTVTGERWDPNTYHDERINAITKLQNSSFKLEKLKLITSLAKKIVVSNDDNLPYIGLNNIESNTGIYIKKEEKETFSSAIQFKQGQVLFPKLRPYLNKVYFADFNGLCSTEFHIFDSHVISNKFLSIFLRSSLVLSQTKHLMSGNTLPRLQTEDIENLLIPIPPDNIQNEIVQKMNDAYQQKQQKEQEAKEKLESIDDYLLDALGIKLPEKQDESVEDRVFFRKFSEVSGERIDPLFYNHEFYIYEKLLKEKPFRKFKYFINSINNGFDFRDYQTRGTPYLKVANIKKGSFDFSKIQYINFDSSEIDKNIKLKKGNLLLTRKGTFGNALALDTDYNYVISSEIFYIELKKELINTDFLEIYFNSYMGQLQFDNNKIGAIMGSLSQGAIRELIIPTPSPNLQETIVIHITNLKNEAKALKEEASQIYNEAKEEVEKMILGEEV